MTKLVFKALVTLSDPINDKGVSPMNSLKVSLKGCLLGSVTIPSLNPLTGSFIKINVIKNNLSQKKVYKNTQ